MKYELNWAFKEQKNLETGDEWRRKAFQLACRSRQMNGGKNKYMRGIKGTNDIRHVRWSLIMEDSVSWEVLDF